MHLYNLTLVRGGAITSVVYGSFTGPKVHELAVSSGSSIGILRPDEYGRVRTVYPSEAFATVRAIAPFRLTGSKRDYLAVASDSGKLSILKYVENVRRLERVHCETFGKSGCRRIVPGQYIAADPKGRALMIAAVEKQKFVYVLNRDAQENLTISSPLEAHKSSTIVYSLVALDVGFENPIFASLEKSYDRKNGVQSKYLVLYELDLGLNHVTRRQVAKVEDSTFVMVSVPGGGDGPGGTLLCSDGWVKYHGVEEEQDPIAARLPYREGEAFGSSMVVSVTLHKQRGMFFFLFCTERGDLIKAEIEWTPEKGASALILLYFDTLPGPAGSMSVMRNGFLFVASELGEHYFFQFQGIGDKDGLKTGISFSKSPVEDKDVALQFQPRAEPVNLTLIDNVDSSAPILSWKIADFHNKRRIDILALCGGGSKSRIRRLTRGFHLMEMANSSLSGIPRGVFTLKSKRDDEYHSHLIVSFTNATMVLAIGDRVEEVSDSGFLLDVSTVRACLLGLDASAQVHPKGIRLVQFDKTASDWNTGDDETIVAASSTPSQIAAYLSTGDVVLFELEPESGSLMETQRLPREEIGVGELGNSPCICYSPSVPGQTRSSLLCVSDGRAKVARVFQIDRKGESRCVAVQVLTSQACSLAMIDGTSSTGSFCLLIGTIDGLLVRARVDLVTGEIRGKRLRYLGSGPVHVYPVQVSGINCALALSSSPWLCHPSPGKEFAVTPVVSERLHNADFFCSEQCPDGFVAVSGSTLRILSFEDPLVVPSSSEDRLGSHAHFSYSSTASKYTPRRIDILDEQAGYVAVASCDQRVRPIAGSELEKALKVGLPRGEAGEWASSLSLMRVETENPSEEADTETLERSAVSTLQEIQFSTNQAVLGLCALSFADKDPQDKYVCVSLAIDLVVEGTGKIPPSENRVRSELRVYRLAISEGQAPVLQIVHTTPLETPCNALAEFHGRLLAGCGRTLSMFELGKKRLLKKSECRRASPNRICTISSLGDRIFVGDVQEGVQLVQYKASQNRLFVIADEATPRWMTCSTPLDYCSVAGGDKFGNLFVVRLPPELSATADEDPSVGAFRESDRSSQHILKTEACFHAGSLIHTISKCSIGGTEEALVYGTLSGSVAALTPLPSQTDIDLFQKLEHQLREKGLSPCGRDHLSYRSSFYPVRNVIDGDLCEMFLTLSHDVQETIAEDLDRTPQEIHEKLEDMRDRII